MATKHTKLHEHGVGPKVVTETELSKLKASPNFGRVYRVDGPATEAEVAQYNSQARSAGKPVEPEAKATVAKPSGNPLPAASSESPAKNS